MTRDRNNRKENQLIYDILGRQYSLPLTEEDTPTKERILMTATLLFAQRGYAAVSVRDIANAIGFKPSSLYNHFDSKESLWAAALNHLKKLYLLYFEQLDRTLGQAGTFKEMQDILFCEPKRMNNLFTCYGFSLIMLEQMRDDLAAEIFSLFLTRGLEVIQTHFDAGVTRGLVPAFDTRTAATIIMNNVFMAIAGKVQQAQGRRTAYDPAALMADLERFLLETVDEGALAGPPAQPLAATVRL